MLLLIFERKTAQILRIIDFDLFKNNTTTKNIKLISCFYKFKSKMGVCF